MCTSQGEDESFLIYLTMQRKRYHLQPCDPAFSASLQYRGFRIAE